MSSIYVLEPPTQGKVVVTTTLGDLDIELWPREAPKAVRNFVQLCLEGYYDKTIFHRIIIGFMVQGGGPTGSGTGVGGGDPTGSGTGGESIYGEPFRDEFHSRLRFSHRGLVACANAGAPHSNGSQWFFTLDRCDWLDKKHTIFGKVGGSPALVRHGMTGMCGRVRVLVHRGANAGMPHSNGSQWFFTLDRCDWLDKEHPIYGKVGGWVAVSSKITGNTIFNAVRLGEGVTTDGYDRPLSPASLFVTTITGDTIFNAVRLGEVDTDDNDRPFDPPSIISVEVIWNPFEDIVPRTLPARQQQETMAKSRGRDKEKRRQQQSQVKGTKQLNLLSFGEEAEEEEAQLEEANLRMRSSHDVLKDPRLLAETAEAVQQKLAGRGGDAEGEEEDEENGRREGGRERERGGGREREMLVRGRDGGRQGEGADGEGGSRRGRKGEETGGKRGNKGSSVGPEEVRGRERGGREESGGEGEGQGDGEEASFDELMRRRVLEKQRRFGKHGVASEGGRRGEKTGRGGVGDGGEREGKGAARIQDGAGTREQAKGGRAKEERGKGEEDDEDGSGDSDGSDGSDDEEGGRGGKGRVRVEKLRLRKGAKGVGKGGGEGGGGGGSAGGGLLGEEEERRQQMRQRKRALGSRQEKTLELLNRFKSKLAASKTTLELLNRFKSKLAASKTTLELLNRFKSKLAASKTVQPRETRTDEDKEEGADEGRADRRDREREGERGRDGSNSSKEGSRKRGFVGSEGKGPGAAAYGPGGKARQDVGGDGEEEDEEGGGVDWMAHRLKFEVKRNKRDEMLRNDDPDQYAVHDPLLEKGKEKFNKMQARMKKRNREWAGRSLD
ncbi:unnamed protein product [Closterium sp. NIES-65]|nr:unnamed protein product [Closterium sp. NIES-65]